MKFRGALLAACIGALPVVANAQPVNGWYMSLGAGADIHPNEDIKNLSLGTGSFGGVSTSGKAQFDVGFASQLSVGWGFGNGFRLEGEGDYLNNHSNGLTDFTGARLAGHPQIALGGLNGGGTEEKAGFMANVLYDFVGLTPAVQPYIGAGVGVQWVNMSGFHASNTATFTGPYISNPIVGATVPAAGLSVMTATDWMAVFAYQAIAGVAFPITSAPGLAITAEYRFLGTSGNRSVAATYTASTNQGSASGHGNVQFGPTYDNMFLVGFRYNFGQVPPPPPAPVAAPAPMVQPARSYLVFFDWDKATLTDRARQIIKEAADNSTHVQYTRIEVNGYTDTSGTPQYNMGLSIRRATAVKAELIKDGVPAAAIATQGFGETHLLVPTGDGVREPQNRRVEIVIL